MVFACKRFFDWKTGGVRTGNDGIRPVSYTHLIYIDPSLACQNVAGSVTNALAVAFTGTLGGGKSMSANNIIYQEVLHGARALILDPKSERGKWKEMLPELSDEINIINLTSDEGKMCIRDRSDAAYLMEI